MVALVIDANIAAHENLCILIDQGKEGGRRVGRGAKWQGHPSLVGLQPMI